MKRLLAVALLMGPLVAGAQVVSTTPPADQAPAPQPQAVPPPPPATPPAPSSNAPQEALPPQSDDSFGGTASSYISTEEVPPQPVAPETATGQWVYTNQYGWVWMPYGAAYTYVAAGAYPDMYLYVPAYGWRWVVAPWVWGIGPHPYFGVYGWARYPWYGHGFGRWYGFRGGPVWAAPRWGHPGWGIRPVPHVVRPGPSGIVHSRPGPPHGFSGPHPGGFHGGNPGGFHGGHSGGFGRH